jgi:hypothetical protein
MHFLTHRRKFIKTVALASASMPIGLRHSSAAPAEQSPAPQIQTPRFGVHFSQASGKLSAWRKSAPFLANTVARRSPPPKTLGGLRLPPGKPSG